MFFNQFYKSFETDNIDTSLISIPFDNAKFGILTFNAVSCNITSQGQEFVFVIDRSGSMSDRCSDGRTKMQHITHTLKNMILYFHENSIQNLYVTVFAFDDIFVPILNRKQINYGNLQEILISIDDIHPNGSTNIELALKKTNEYISQLKIDNPQHNISHIFMTDGDATIGSKDPTILRSLVDTNVENAFIGFGINHDALLLNHISSDKNNSYHFIDALEKAGLVYGEILHGILYKYLTDTEITIENGLVYDFVTNNWVNKLFIGNIVGEANKTYHIISNNPDNCNIILTCKNLDEEYSFQANELINAETKHTKYMYRQRTLELLFEVSQLQKNKIEEQKFVPSMSFKKKSNNSDESNLKLNLIKEEERELKQKLHLFFDEIKKYMADNNLNDDSFLKNLCDDIYISHRTLGTRYGNMYSTARQASQGTQRCYTVSHTPEEEGEFGFTSKTVLKMPRLFRQTVAFHTPNLFEDLDLDDIDNYRLQHPDDIIHNISNFDEAPYLTPTATRLMRDVSASHNYEVFSYDKEEESQAI